MNGESYALTRDTLGGIVRQHELQNGTLVGERMDC